MAKLLYIESSPRKERSASIAVAQHFINAYRTAHPGDTVEVLDLWKTGLPHFDQFTIDAKYAVMSGQRFTPEQAAAWNAVTKVIEHFKSADKFVFSVPMWNFSIPYILKHYIDILAQPGLTFSYSPTEVTRGWSRESRRRWFTRGRSVWPGHRGGSVRQTKRLSAPYPGFHGHHGRETDFCRADPGRARCER